MKEYQAYLFDADGTLIDTREMIYQSFAHMGKAMGAALPPRAYIESTVGLPVVAQMRLLLGEGKGEDYYARAREHYRDHMNSVYRDYLAMFPGTAEVLAKLHGMGKKLAVVTSRTRGSLVRFLEELDILKYFSALVTPDDTEKHKPDPEPAFLALKLLGALPDEAVFIGDAEFDIACGKAAGMDAAFVEWGGMDPAVWPVRPDFVAKTFDDLLPER